MPEPSARSAEAARPRLLARIGPGILVAATGIGAGDLLTASLGGSTVGVALLWAAPVGAALKWLLNEGIARWQLATGTTLLEGWTRLGSWIRWLFLAYFLGWSFFTGGALISACGVGGTALLPLSEDPEASKRIWGVLHSVAGLVLVWVGGFSLFRRLMSVCIGLMVVTVAATALLSKPDWGAAVRGLVPSFPPGGTGWVLGLLGGIGGTVTLLNYGYWLREEGAVGAQRLRDSQVDLGVGYAMTALFGMAMVLIGSTVSLEGSGVRVAPLLAERLEAVTGPAGRWVFLTGFWGAVFSSMLGVWQGVPYLFADFLRLHRGQGRAGEVDLKATRAYRVYLVALALVPLPMLWVSVQRAQLAYAVLGSLFIPLLALTLLLLNNRREWVGPLRSGWLINAVLVGALLFFAAVGYQEAVDVIRRLRGG